MDAITILSVAGTLLWVVALAIMAGASRTAMRQVPEGTPVPMLWDNKRVVLWRAPRTLGLMLIPAIAFVGGLVLLYLAMTSADLIAAVIWLGVRALIAPLIALAHLGHIKRAIQTLGAEGRLTP